MLRSGYLAKEGLLKNLLEELQDPKALVLDHLVLSTLPYQELYFKQNGWKEVETFAFSSIKEAARLLRAKGKYWAFYPTTLYRRGLLIQENLAKAPVKPLLFPTSLPSTSYGGWTLLDEKTLVFSKETTSPFPHGEVLFEEDKTLPSRAYLKLYEAFMQVGSLPQKGEKCLEIGASPGSWSSILATLGAQLTCCDRAPLAPSLKRFSNLRFVQGDAFKLTPQEVGPIDWLFSDLICYPDKLFDYIRLWLESGLCKNFICTLKFQEGISLKALENFEKIPGSRLLHLFHNKHEITWMKTS